MAGDATSGVAWPTLLLQALLRVTGISAAGTAMTTADHEREGAELCVARGALHLAQNRPTEAIVALAPVIKGSVPTDSRAWQVQAALLDAIAHDALEDAQAAAGSLERALELAEPDGILLPFLLYPAPDLLGRHLRHRTAHAALLRNILDLLGSGRQPRQVPHRPLVEPLSASELRVLRYLPTNLSAAEIGAEIHVSVNTVKTHLRHLYAKLGAHGRTQAVARARELGLLAPPAQLAHPGRSAWHRPGGTNVLPMPAAA